MTPRIRVAIAGLATFIGTAAVSMLPSAAWADTGPAEVVSDSTSFDTSLGDRASADGLSTIYLGLPAPAVRKRCNPTSTSTWIGAPEAHVYYGAVNSIYLWKAEVEAWVDGCSNNAVTVSARMEDHALDGSGSPVVGPERTARGKSWAHVDIELVQSYSNVAMATNLSYHQISIEAHATQTDGTTTTTWCASQTWTYLATVTGPQFVYRGEPVDCPT